MESKNGETKKPSNYPARSCPPIKLKDKPGRGGVFFNLKDTFGFVPEVVVIQKVAGDHDKFVFSAILTPEALANEKAKAEAAKEKKEKIASNATSIKK